MKSTRIFSIIISLMIAVCGLTMCDYADRTNPDDPKSDDYIAPPEGTFVIGNGIATNHTDVTLTINVPGATEMRFGNTVNERNSSDWNDYSETLAWTIEGTPEGEKTVYGEFRNILDEAIQPAASIFYDVTAPIGGSLIINSGDIVTTSTSVTLTVSATDDIAMGTMCFSNDNATWSDWEAYAESASWTIPETVGTYTVYGRFRDAAGNEAASALSDSIIYDNTPESEMLIRQESADIPDGGSFGFGVTSKNYGQDRVFTIHNLGSADLTTGTVAVAGDASFSVLSQPAETTIVPGSSTTFSIRFKPASTGTKTAEVSLSSNDADENPYNFTISGLCEIGRGIYGLTHRIGGTGFDYGYSAVADSSGNIYVGGSYSGTTINFRADFDTTADNRTPEGSADIFVTKINSDGSYGWTRRIGDDTSTEIISALAVDSSDNVYLTGYFSGTLDFRADFDTTADEKTSDTSSNDIFVTKINSDGSYGWTRRIGDTGNDNGLSVTVFSDTNVYVIGNFIGTVDFSEDFATGPDSKTAAGTYDIFVTMLESDGDYGWTRRIGGAGENSGNSIATDSYGNIYITGGVYGSSPITINFRAGFDLTADNKTTLGSYDTYVTKINSGGSYGWTRLIGGTGQDSGRSIVIDVNDYVYVTGYFEYDVDFSADFVGATADSKTSNGSLDVFVTMIESNGDYGWTRQIGGTSMDFSYSVAADSGGNIYVGGTFFSTVNFRDDFDTTADSKTSAGNSDLFVTKINNDESYGWTYRMGGANNDNFRSIAIDINDYIYLTGDFTDTVVFDTDFGTTADSKTPAGNCDVFIMKMY